VSHEALGPGQVTELRLADKVYTWKIKKIDGGEEQILLLKVLVTVATDCQSLVLCPHEE
jgi:hypothetical protein